MRTLYFEGAGWSDADISKATVGNCRVRTAFRTQQGKPIFLEATCFDKRERKFPPAWARWTYTGCAEAYEINLSDPDDLTGNDRINLGENAHFNYTEGGLIRLANYIGGDFDSVVVLPDLGGYRVFAENGKYNFSERFRYNPELIKKREAVYGLVYDMEKGELLQDRLNRTGKFVHGTGEDYPNFFMWVDPHDENALFLLRHFSGYNRKWRILIGANGGPEDWLKNANEIAMGSYSHF